MPDFSIGGNTITEMSIGGKTITEAWIGGNKVYDANVYSLTLTLSESIANASIQDADGNTLTSVVIASEESTTVYLGGDNGYTYTSFPFGQVSSGTNFTSELGGLSGGRVPITLTANTLTSNVSETATFGFSAPTAIGYSVTGTATTSGSTTGWHIQSVDGDTSSPFEVSETRTVSAGGSFTVLVDANSGYQFASATSASLGGLTSFVQGTRSINAAKTRITIPVTYPAGASNLDDDFTVSATAALIPTYSGSFGYTNLNSNIQSVSFSPTGYSNEVAGASVSTTATFTAKTGYNFNGSSTTTQSYNGTVPSGGGDINFNVSSIVPTLTQVSGSLVYTVPSMVNQVASESYGPVNPNSSVSYSVTLQIASAFQSTHEFSNGESTIIASGSVNVGSGGNVTVDLTSYLPTVKNTLSNVNPTSLSFPASGGDRTFTFTQTGSNVPTITGLASWLSQVGTLTASSTSATIRASAHTGAARSDGFSLNKTGASSITITANQDAGQAPATNGTLSPSTISFTLGTAGTATLTVDVNTNGQWNLQGGGNNITLNGTAGGTGITGTGDATITVAYNGAIGAKDGTFTLRSGHTIGSGNQLSTAALDFSF